MIDKLKNKKDLIFILLILLFLSTRLIILYISPYIYQREECYIGTIATELINGPKFSLFQYSFKYHYPGALFAGIITVPFFLIFGQSWVSLKLVGLFIALLTLIVIYLFLDKFFNHKAAVFFALLSIFSMPFYTTYQLTSFGTHSYPLLFDAIIMFLFYCIFFDNKKDFKHFLLFGFMCGFAAWFIFKSLIMIFTCFLFWFIFDKKFFLRKYFFIFVTFFLVGFSPWMYYNFTHEFQGIFNTKMEDTFGGIIGPNSINFYSNTIIKARYRFFSFIVKDIPNSFGFKNFGFLSGKFLSYSYYFIFLFAFFIIFWYCRKSIFKLILGIIPLEKNNVLPNKIKKESFILAYPIIFLVAYSLTNIDTTPRYLLALYSFILIILSLFIAKLWNKKALRPISVFIITLLLLIGLIGNCSLISFSDTKGADKIYKHNCYYLLASQIGEKIYSINSAIYQCSKFDLEYQQYCYMSFSENIFEKCKKDVLCFTHECNKLEEDSRIYCYEGLGHFVYKKHSNNLTKALDICDLFDKDYKNYCYKGFCGKVRYYKNYCYKGFCEKVSSYFDGNSKETIRDIDKVDSECKEPY